MLFRSDDSGSFEIASAVIALAHSLDIRVVAEGVEKEPQWRLLRDQGCDEVQGYFFCAPLTAADCQRLILERPQVALPIATAAADSADSDTEPGERAALG